MKQKTTFVTKPEVETTHILVDASEKILGRLATKIATSLMGKDQANYTPNVNPHVHVVVLNAEKIMLTGTKAETKTYDHFTGHVGGLKTRSYEMLMEKNPTEIIYLAVKRMLPKNGLGKKIFKNLRVFVGTEHRHGAQNPTPAGY